MHNKTIKRTNDKRERSHKRRLSDIIKQNQKKDKNLTARFKDDIAAAFKAISGKDDVKISFPFAIKGTPAKAYYNQAANTASIPVFETLNKKLVSATRGEADKLSCFLRYHNPELTEEFPANGDFINSLEEVRAATLGTLEFKGVAENIKQNWNINFTESGFHIKENISNIPPIEVISLLAFEKMTGVRIPAAEEALKSIGKIIGRKIEPELNELAKAKNDQRLFAQIAAKIAHKLGTSGENDKEEKGEHPHSASEAGNEEEKQPSNSIKEAQAIPQTDNDAKGSTPAKVETIDDKKAKEGDSTGDMMEKPRPKWEVMENVAFFYHPYTTKFDQTARVEILAKPEELEQHRATLERKLDEIKNITTRLAAKLQRKLMARQERSWDFNMEEGVLDPAKLSAVIIDATYPYPYKWERDAEYKDTVVSMLIDNSGSMRGRPILMAAMCADILARTLERVGVKTEILGFTTKNWKGGEARKLWEKKGAPQNPGRLNDILHIVYKDAATTWRKSKRNLGLMLREGILKENIDGEAVLWAHDRLLARPEKRKILMVISDGAPVDDSTLSSNPGNYLDQHLRNVIHRIEHYHGVELLAIGIGHNVTEHYKRSVMINNIEHLGEAMIGQLSDLFEEQKPHHRKLRAKTI